MRTAERNFTRRLDLTSLQLFVAVCEHGSIGKAAKESFIAASAVSKRMADLESALATPLLYRHARGIKITPAGERFLHHARFLLFSIEKMQGELSEYADGVRGHVRIHANMSAIVQFLPEDLSNFTKMNPDVKIDLEEQVSDNIVRSVQDGDTDLGICNPLVDLGTLQTRAYRTDKLILAVPSQHTLALLPEIAFADTLAYDHVGLHSNSAIHLTMRRAAAAVNKTILLRIQVAGLDAMCRMIHFGLGIGVLPLRAFELLESVGDLRAVPLSDSWAVRTIQLVARDFDTLPMAARILADNLSAQHMSNTNTLRLG